MKKLILLSLLVLGVAYPSNILAFLGLGAARYGISSSDPLGSPTKLNDLLVNSHYRGDLGTSGKPRKLSYEVDDKHTNTSSAIDIVVGEEEYIQKIVGSFLGSQHGYTPQKKTVTEAIMESLWQAAGGPAKPKFERVTKTVMKIPWSVKFGKSMNINETYGVATFESGDVKGTWAYSESYPAEVITLELK